MASQSSFIKPGTENNTLHLCLQRNSPHAKATWQATPGVVAVSFFQRDFRKGEHTQFLPIALILHDLSPDGKTWITSAS